jgi:hypothetical protein
MIPSSEKLLWMFHIANSNRRILCRLVTRSFAPVLEALPRRQRDQVARQKAQEDRLQCQKKCTVFHVPMSISESLCADGNRLPPHPQKLLSRQTAEITIFIENLCDLLFETGRAAVYTHTDRIHLIPIDVFVLSPIQRAEAAVSRRSI